MSTTYGTCALQFPSSYVPMGAEEMEYLEGGGTVSIYVSKRAVQQILTVGAGVAVGMVCQALTENPYISVIVGGVASLLVDYVLNNVWSPKAINVSFTRTWIPNFSFSYK